MASSVRDPASSCQAGYPCTDFKLGALPQIGSTVSHALSSQGVFWLAALCLILFAVLVVCPAVWSSKPSRRRAALAVLDRLIRWRW
jgi:hypothetical protein